MFQHILLLPEKNGTDAIYLSFSFCFQSKKELLQNFSLLAETGYAEGVMCHTLVKGGIIDKQNVSIGVPLLVRPRKLLVNIFKTVWPRETSSPQISEFDSVFSIF